jgi:glucosamine--fructose-6-phosphate aminotransferase (isomerizing)
MEKTLFVACGRSDGRTVILLPEVEQNRTTGITLLHVKLQETLPATTMRGVLSSYRNRYAALKDAVTETESSFDETLLEQMPVVDLLTQPLLQLADRWRQGRPERSPA